MYARKDHIEEEELDWGENLEEIVHPEIEPETKETKQIIQPVKDNKKIILKKKFQTSKEKIKSYIMDFVNEFTEISLLLSLLLAPYLIGFLIISFILISGGVPINRFLSLKEGIFHFELWSIGAYIFITAVVIWLVMMLFKHR